MFSGISAWFDGIGGNFTRNLRWKIEYIIDSVLFEKILLLMIIANVFVMASEYYG